MTILAATSAGWVTPGNTTGANTPFYDSTPVTASSAGTANNGILYVSTGGWALAGTVMKLSIYRQSSLLLVGTASFAAADGVGTLTKAFDTPFAVANGEQFYGLVVTDGAVTLDGDTATFMTQLRTGTFASPPAAIVPGGGTPDATDSRPMFRFSIDGAASAAANPPPGWDKRGAMGVMVAM